MATTKPTPSLAELEQRVLDGDGTVTPGMLAHAREIAQWEALRAEAERQQAARQAEADRVARVEKVKAEILSQAGDTDADQADADLIRDAAARIITRAKNRYAAVNHGIASLRRLGLTEGEEYAGAAWKNASMGQSDAVIIDGRRIGQTPAGPALADALAGALADAGVQRGYLAPLIHVHGNAQPRQKATQ